MNHWKVVSHLSYLVLICVVSYPQLVTFVVVYISCTCVLFLLFCFVPVYMFRLLQYFIWMVHMFQLCCFILSMSTFCTIPEQRNVRKNRGGGGGQYKIDNPETQADVGIPHKTNRNKTNKCETENKIKHNTENKNRRTKHGVDPTCSGRVSHSCLLYKTPVVLLIDKAVFHSFCVSAHVLWFFQYPIAIVHVSHFCCFVPAHIIWLFMLFYVNKCTVTVLLFLNNTVWVW